MPLEYGKIISPENLLAAWQEFTKGKRYRADVLEFQHHLMGNLIALQHDLANGTYRHGTYRRFIVTDPKRRIIHKATVRDRVIHRAIYRILYLYFHPRFIHDSYSCRNGKGTHKAIKKFAGEAFKLSRNNTKAVWVLKCDIRQFFASIDQEMLLGLLKRKIPDKSVLGLIEKVVRSFNSTEPGKGLPLGNLTSQLFANVYLNELDQFMKHRLKVRCYLRYADDFVIADHDKDRLLEMTPKIADFLEEKLKLNLHSNKIFLKTIASGVDFLGWVNFPSHRVLRTSTKRRMFRNIKAKQGKPETVQSYLGMLVHGNSQKLRNQIETLIKN